MRNSNGFGLVFDRTGYQISFESLIELQNLRDENQGLKEENRILKKKNERSERANQNMSRYMINVLQGKKVRYGS